MLSATSLCLAATALTGVVRAVASHGTASMADYQIIEFFFFSIVITKVLR